jgi:hypothetical protein
MSLAYCRDCLEREDQCKCVNPSGAVVYGEKSVSYVEGYRAGYEDAKEGKESDYAKK